MSKLDQIRAILDAPEAEVPAYEHPEIPSSRIPWEKCDGVTILADGSTWTTWNSPLWVPNSEGKKVKIGLIYGYISKAKDPAQWDRMVSAFGGDEARLQSIIDGNGKLARYKTKPDAVLFQGDNSFFLLSSLLSNPMPEALPS